MQAEVIAKLTKGENDKAKSTANNYFLVFKHDPVLAGVIRRNELTGKIDIVDEMWWHRDSPPLTDVDLKYLILYCEDVYGIGSEKKIENAVAVIANENRFHPIRDYLEPLQWDGQERIRYCLHHFLGADTDDYTYEALKLFLMGALARVYHPGCKFEYMLCLVGGQGAGKSTFFRFLSIRDEWFSDDLKQLGSDSVYEKLQGHWIIEMSEMLATANARSIEEIKSFLSRQRETYRVPYDKFSADRPRQCVFGGTSNNMDFLPLDRTGNRRFLPIEVHPEQAEVHILADETASRAYIDQLWAEAMTIYRSGDFRLHLDPEMERYLKVHQQDFMPEDTKAIRIQNFLDAYKGDKVCTMLLYREALGRFDEPKDWELKEIRNIMRNSIHGWQEYDNPRRFSEYGRQRGWERIPAGTENQHMEQFSILEADQDDDLPDAW